jgi:hypothetical protein
MFPFSLGRELSKRSSFLYLAGVVKVVSFLLLSLSGVALLERLKEVLLLL